MLRRFDQVEGLFINKIIGQDRYAFSHSDPEDLFDVLQIAKRGEYRGSVLSFYDFNKGKVIRPFEKRKNILYSDPFYVSSNYYFLQGNFEERKVVLYRYIPEKVLDVVKEFSMEEVKLYNIQIVGNPLYLISENEDTLEIYYPERLSLSLNPRQSVCFIEEGKVYLEEWVEEGWDKENECAGDDYKFYHKIIVKDFSGNILSEEVGAIHQAADGTYWVS